MSFLQDLEGSVSLPRFSPSSGLCGTIVWTIPVPKCSAPWPLVFRRGCRPFVIPAMGSDGNACAEGQKGGLASLGITEASVGWPVRSSVDVIEIGRLEDCGLPVWVDAMAARADGIFVVNRVKPHTAFSGRHESGLVKMLSVGLGSGFDDQGRAQALHRKSSGNMSTAMVRVPSALPFASCWASNSPRA